MSNYLKNNEDITKNFVLTGTSSPYNTGYMSKYYGDSDFSQLFDTFDTNTIPINSNWTNTTNYLVKDYDNTPKDLGNILTNIKKDSFGTPNGVFDYSLFNIFVYAIAIDSNGIIYIGGDFAYACNTILVNNIAIWDGTFKPLGGYKMVGSGTNGVINGTNGPVRSIAIHSDNTVYIGGQFTKAGGISANNIARWNGNWSALGEGLSTSASKTFTVSTICIHGENVYVGGNFTYAGSTTVSNIAVWNVVNSSWSSLGTGILNSGPVLNNTGTVNAIEVNLDNSNIYVGGEFITAGGISANNIAKWDGTSWTALGGGVNGRINAITILNANIYVGGFFSYVNGTIQTANIAILNGTTWSALLPVFESDTINGLGTGNDEIYTIEKHNNNIFIGGNINSGNRLNNIIMWDGSWHLLNDTASCGTNSIIYSIKRTSDEVVFIGGAFTKFTLGRNDVNVYFTNRIAYLYIYLVSSVSDINMYTIGEEKSTTTSNNGILGLRHGTVYCMVTSGSDIYVGGMFTRVYDNSIPLTVNCIAKWNGSNWSELGTGVTNGVAVYAIAIYGYDIYIGGNFTSVGGITASNIAKWDGISWSALGGGVNGTVRAIVIDLDGTIGQPGYVYVGGDFTSMNYTIASSIVNYIAVWTGTAWTFINATTVNIGSNNTRLEGGTGVRALCIYNRQLFIGGNFSAVVNSNIGRTVNNIAVWNGPKSTNFQPLTFGSLGVRKNGVNDTVRGIAIDIVNSKIYIVGSFSTAFIDYIIPGLTSSPGAICWNTNTQRWNNLGTGIVIGTIRAIKIDSNQNVYIGGSYISASGVTVNNIALWNGTSWSALGTGVSGTGTGDGVYAIEIDNLNNVYIGGNFLSVNGTTSNTTKCLAKWNGTTWSTVGDAIFGTSPTPLINAIGIDSNNNLYIGGTFSTINGTTMNNIAKWNGTSWSALGTGTTGVVRAIQIDSNNNVYVGGSFTSVNGNTAIKYFAKWNGTWSNAGAVFSGVVYAISRDNSNNIYVGGTFTNLGTALSNVTNIASYDGTNWYRFGTSAKQGWSTQVNAIACDNNNNVYIGGSVNSIVNSATQTSFYISAIGYYNLSTSLWYGLGPIYKTVLATTPSNPAGAGSSVGTITCMVISSNDLLYVGGIFSNTSSQDNPNTDSSQHELTSNNIACFNIKTWTWSKLLNGVSVNTALSNTFSRVFSITIDSNNNLYVGGIFVTASDIPCNFIAKWVVSSSTWKILGSSKVNGVESYNTPNSRSINTEYYRIGIYALLFSMNKLYIGGYFNICYNDSISSILSITP